MSASNPKPVEGARELIAKWRKLAMVTKVSYLPGKGYTDRGYALDECADELEAALSAAPSEKQDEKTK